MAEKNTAGFIEEWQRGAGYLLVSAFVGAVFGGLLGAPGFGYLGVIGFFAGGLLAFLVLSYLRYGR